VAVGSDLGIEIMKALRAFFVGVATHSVGTSTITRNIAAIITALRGLAREGGACGVVQKITDRTLEFNTRSASKRAICILTPVSFLLDSRRPSRVARIVPFAEDVAAARRPLHVDARDKLRLYTGWPPSFGFGLT